MNMKNTFKKMVAFLGITGISIVSLAMPAQAQKSKAETNDRSTRKKKN